MLLCGLWFQLALLPAPGWERVGTAAGTAGPAIASFTLDKKLQEKEHGAKQRDRKGAVLQQSCQCSRTTVW